MSRHPMYLAVDEARMNEIQRSFEEYCKDDFILVKKERQATNQPEGYMTWPLFLIKNKKKEVVATFDPDGTFELLDRKFKKIFEKIVKSVEKVATEETREVKHFELREHAERHGFDPTFYQKKREEEND